METLMDVRVVKSLINEVLLRGDNIFTEDATKLCQAIVDSDYGVLGQLAAKYILKPAD